MGNRLKRSKLALIIACAWLLSCTAISFAKDPDEIARAASTCSTSGPISGLYTVTVCFDSPVAQGPLSGNTTVTASVSVNPPPLPGAATPIQKVVFYLGGAYLLTDFQAPYTFTLPSARWVDGRYSLAAAASLRDGFVSSQTFIQVNLVNGVTTPPLNQNQFTPTGGTSPPLPDDPLVVAAVGDGASGEANSAGVVSQIASWNPNLFLYLGDVYENGTPTEFYNWYGVSSQLFSRFRSITNPTIGNHEYTNGVAPGYFDYWDNIPNYYSFDSWGWHFISVNANSVYGQPSPGSPQYQWLLQDLAANQANCTLVYWHQPLYNIGQEPPATYMQAIWALLVQSKVDLVLTGHDHDYQRWVPLDGSGQPSQDGVTEFVVGSGGHGLQTFKSSDPRVAVGFDSSTLPRAFGALRLRLYANHAAYDFINTQGNFLDSGTIACKKAATVVVPTYSLYLPAVIR